MVARIGIWSYRNRRKAVGIWIASVVAIIVISGAAGSAFSGEFTSPDSESTEGFAILAESFPEQGASINRGSIVFEAEQGVADSEVVTAMEELFALAEENEGLTVISPYSDFGAQQISPDGRVAFASVNLTLDIDQTESGAMGEELFENRPEIDGLTVEIGGAVLSVFEPPETELIGLAFAIVVLIISFGSVLAMGLPIGVALAGVITGSALVGLISHIKQMPDFTTLIGVMIGLGVGIAYALFIVTRYRTEEHAGHDRDTAMFIAMDTAGRAVLFAGITVVLSLLGMLFIGLPFISGLGVGAATTVGVTLLAALTLLPALISFAGHRIELTRFRGLIAAGFMAIALFLLGLGSRIPAAALVVLAIVVLAFGRIGFLGREVPHRPPKPLRDTFWYKWSRQLQARPWTVFIASAVALLILAAPLLDLRLAFGDEGNFPEDTSTRKAYDLLADGFGPGFNGPMLIAMETGSPDATDVVMALPAALASVDGVQAVSPPFPSEVNPGAFLMQLIPTTAPQDEATEQLVLTLREEAIPAAIGDADLSVKVTGAVPGAVDFSDYMAGRTPLFFGAVLLISLLLLMAVFRSLLVPVKAVIMNTLSIASAYGVLVAIFQWGWFSGVFGIEPAPIEPWIPMMLFAIVFGLSMDYEVFLLSRIKEEFDRTGDAVESVADGLASTARVISAAAAIMVVVFGSFLLEDDRNIKLMGTGLALAVFLDATLVRMLLVPATMELLGEKNWWLPKWIDRILPQINVEGPSHDLIGAPAGGGDIDAAEADDDLIPAE
ncbi:MAG: MMPL family transporter [Acidimicrobiales bacterium]